MSRVITFVSLKGGATKSTSCFIIAHHLGTSGYSVLAIDGDKNRSLYNWWNRGENQPFSCVGATQAPMVMGSKQFDFVLIDSAARPSNDDIEGLAGASLVVLCSTPDPMSVESVVELVALLPPECNYRVLVGLSPPKPSKDGQVAIASLKDAGILCFDKPIRRLKAYVTASLKGTTIKGQGRNDWKEIFAFITAL